MRYFLFLIAALFFKPVFANITVYFNYGVFNTTNSKPYLETYLTVSGSSVKFLPINTGLQASVNISWKILKGKEVVRESNYNLMSPIASDSLHLPSFIDNQRFSLDNGQYVLELIVTDNADKERKSTHSEKINISLSRDKKVYNSDIQILESFTKSTTQSVLTKNGYDLIPYNINYFPKKQNALKFYVETYNLDTVLGKSSKFVYSYYIENNENLQKQMGLSGFQKQNAGKINPLLAQFDITQLPSGNYNLVIEVKDSLNKIQSQKKWFFQRQSDARSIALNENTNFKTLEEFFNAVQSTDSLKEFVECLWPVSGFKERDWQQVQLKRKEPNLMRSYLVGYWKEQSADTTDPLQLWYTYYKQVLQTNALLKCGKQKGYFTDRGRVYLQYGKPDQRNQVNSEADTYPYEIWHYYRIYDKATKRFFTNKRFVFANFAIADDCYKLIHSEVRGELYDERWKLRLVKRTEQEPNLDKTEHKEYFGNSINENFNTPR
ncbi:MAG: GWxTD domain-containing protein [Burkholderiales bacterium]|nr:GWxTD domain-containing protein [Bacteroidia bacterium]